MINIKRHFLTKILSLFMVFNLVSCGTILYPERKGQTGGQLDAGVVILDAVGLFFFFIPGVIAFAVDFSNGTIYAPGGHSSTLSPDEMESISASDVEGGVDKEKLAQLLREKGLVRDFFDSRDLQVRAVGQGEEIAALINNTVTRLSMK